MDKGADKMMMIIMIEIVMITIEKIVLIDIIVMIEVKIVMIEEIDKAEMMIEEDSKEKDKMIVIEEVIHREMEVMLLLDKGVEVVKVIKE